MRPDKEPASRELVKDLKKSEPALRENEWRRSKWFGITIGALLLAALIIGLTRSC